MFHQLCRGGLGSKVDIFKLSLLAHNIDNKLNLERFQSENVKYIIDLLHHLFSFVFVCFVVLFCYPNNETYPPTVQDCS